MQTPAVAAPAELEGNGSPTPTPLELRLFVAAVVVAGAGVIVRCLATVHQIPANPYVLLLAVAIIASGRFSIKVPGRSATVSVSEVFVFAGVLLFGPAAATLVVALDGLCTSLLQENRRLYRTLFNIAEPAISTWAAGQVFFAIHGPHTPVAGTPAVVAGAVAMAAVFFALNSGLTALAIGLESGTSSFEIWLRHAKFLAANYYAAASLAALAVSNGDGINLPMVALAVPLLIVSYLAYNEASNRVDEANRHVHEVGHLYQAATEMLAIAVDAKDRVTHGHIRRVQRHTLAIARALGVTDRTELKAIEAGALLHDIGKLAVPDFVLNKPSALTRAEYEIIKSHAPMGARILAAVDFPYPIVPIVRHHHEQWDGRGYPDGLAGPGIPQGARIIAVVDCYDALTSDRPYRPKLDSSSAIDILRQRKGTFYDPAVVDKFIDLLPLLEQDDDAEHASSATASVVAGLMRPGAESTAPGAAEDGGCPIPRRVRDVIDRHVSTVAGAHACLFALTPARDAVTVAYATGSLRRIVGSVALPVGSGVSGWVAGNRSTIRHTDPALDLGDLATAAGLRSCTSTPVFVGADVFGALTVYRTGAAPSNEFVTGLAVLAQEIGLAMARQDAEPDGTGTPLFPNYPGATPYAVMAS